jgi:glutathione-regulated potassium-efflux system ancillary protein KefG
LCFSATDPKTTSVTDTPSTLVMFAHPALERARLGPAMAEAAASAPGVAFRDLYELYPDFTVDVAAEQAAVRAARALVLQFPFYWYSTPALMKEWLDLVLTHGFAYGAEGHALEGKLFACAITTGGPQDPAPTSADERYGVEDYLRPLQETARLCSMRWKKPFVVHGGTIRTDAARDKAAARYAAWLAKLGAAQ